MCIRDSFKGKTEKQVLAEATEAGLLIGDVSYEESEDCLLYTSNSRPFLRKTP